MNIGKLYNGRRFQTLKYLNHETIFKNWIKLHH